MAFTLDRDTDIIYSPDDRGWYWQSYRHHLGVGESMSKRLYPTKEAAIAAYRRWEKRKAVSR